jgi:hypothetical protein
LKVIFSTFNLFPFDSDVDAAWLERLSCVTSRRFLQLFSKVILV